MVVGYHADASALAPNGWVTGSEWDWGALYNDIVDTALAGKFTGSKYNANYRVGFKDGANPFMQSKFGSMVDAEHPGADRRREKERISTTGSPFDGPVVAQDGTVHVRRRRDDRLRHGRGRRTPSSSRVSSARSRRADDARLRHRTPTRGRTTGRSAPTAHGTRACAAPSARLVDAGPDAAARRRTAGRARRLPAPARRSRSCWVRHGTPRRPGGGSACCPVRGTADWRAGRHARRRRRRRRRRRVGRLVRLRPRRRAARRPHPGGRARRAGQRADRRLHRAHPQRPRPRVPRAHRRLRPARRRPRRPRPPQPDDVGRHLRCPRHRSPT